MITRDDVIEANFASRLPSPAKHILLTLALASDPRDRTIPPGRRVSLGDIERYTGLARSTVGELVVSLERAGWIDRNPESPVEVVCGTWALRIGAPTCERRAALTEEVRRAIFERDGRKCRECGTTVDLTIDHINPWSAGGSDSPSNLQVLCRSCNSRKGARPARQVA